MASIALSTAGILFGYAVETTKGTMPSAFTKIPGAMSLPALNSAPENIDVTTLDETEFKSYIKGLKDTGGAVAIKFSLTDDFQTKWSAFVTASETAAASDLATWIVFYVPGMTKSFFFTGEPSELGFEGAEPNSHLQIQAYVTPNKIQGWKTAVTPS